MEGERLSTEPFHGKPVTSYELSPHMQGPFSRALPSQSHKRHHKDATGNCPLTGMHFSEETDL